MPPVAFAAAVPLFNPKQRGVEDMETFTAVGCVTVTDAVAVHELASVAVTV